MAVRQDSVAAASAMSAPPAHCALLGLSPRHHAAREARSRLQGRAPACHVQPAATRAKAAQRNAFSAQLDPTAAGSCLPLQVEVDDVDALNKTAIRLQVAGMLGIPLHSMSLDFGTSRRRLAHLFRARLRRLVALDFVVTIIEEPALDIATAESIWRSKNVSTLSAELGMDVTDAPSPVVAKKVIIQNATVSTLVLVECGAGYWGANGQCIPCAKGTYRSGRTNSSECLECAAGTYMPFLGGSECISCGAGNYSANTLSCEPCQVGEYCVAGTQVGIRCPLAHSTTFGRGARDKDDCVCQAGYFLGNNSCEVCPGGTNCSGVGVSVASLPLLPGWWRLQNSTQIERCFATSNCTGGANAKELCGIGYEARASTPNPNSS